MNRQRRRIALLAGAMVVWPQGTFPQAAPKKARVGMLIASRAETTEHLRSAFISRLAELGWREGRNIEYVVRYAMGDAANWAPLATEMVALKPDVIFVGFGPFAAVVGNHTKNIPIVFSMSQDPVGEGVVKSLARPGGNVTGTSTRNIELTAKRLQLLKELLPSVRRVGVVRRVGQGLSSEDQRVSEELKQAAGRLGLELIEVRHEHRLAGDFSAAFAQLMAKRAEAVASVVVWNYPNYQEFAQHAARSRLPAICDASEFADSGALLSLSIDRAERYRKSAEYVNRILRGAKPADLPVDEPTAFELVVNQRTARELGIRVPQSIVFRADRVIE